MRQFHSRLGPRWRSYDYMQSGAYFVTAVTHRRRRVFGKLTSDGMRLTRAGHVVQRCWEDVQQRFAGVTVDTFVVMPDHVHAIVVLSLIEDRTVDLSDVVGWVKRRASRQINVQAVYTPAIDRPNVRQSPTTPIPLWQRGFHDRIIRSTIALERIRHYILANPTRGWATQEIRLLRYP